MDIQKVHYDGLIPNNVELSRDTRVKHALERWHPGYIDWWQDMGPEGFQEALVYLRTAVSVDSKGWAKFDYVRMPEYRWGILLAPQEDNRTIYQINNQYFIQHNEIERLQVYGGDYRASRSRDGNTISTFTKPGGIRIEVEVDTYGRPLRRVRILPSGERHVLFENRPFAAGVGFSFGSFIVDLPPPEIDIPREQYIVNADEAPEDDIYNALEAPPVEPLERTYTLDEVCASVRLRERMRSVNIDTIHFEFGSWEIGPDQASRLETVAAIMKGIVSQNPQEVFLIEGHTDAVGSAVDNLSLSDRRAEAIANVLSQQFGVPSENLVTRGYGKQFLLIGTDGPERRNRRAVIRRITPLLSSDDTRVGGGFYESRDRYRR